MRETGGLTSKVSAYQKRMVDRNEKNPSKPTNWCRRDLLSWWKVQMYSLGLINYVSLPKWKRVPENTEGDPFMGPAGGEFYFSSISPSGKCGSLILVEGFKQLHTFLLNTCIADTDISNFSKNKTKSSARICFN